MAGPTSVQYSYQHLHMHVFTAFIVFKFTISVVTDYKQKNGAVSNYA